MPPRTETNDLPFPHPLASTLLPGGSTLVLQFRVATFSYGTATFLANIIHFPPLSRVLNHGGSVVITITIQGSPPVVGVALRRLLRSHPPGLGNLHRRRREGERGEGEGQCPASCWGAGMMARKGTECSFDTCTTPRGPSGVWHFATELTSAGSDQGAGGG